MTAGHSFIRRQPQISLFSFFSTGGAISCSVCFRVVCKQNGPEKLVPERERGREKSLSISFVAVLRNGRNDVKRLPSLPCRQATTVIRILFVQRDRPAITFFSFFFSFAVFFHRLVFVWSQSPSAPFMDVTSIIHNPRTAAGYNPKL